MSFNFKSKKGLKIGYHRIGFGLNNALERHKLEGHKLERHKLENISKNKHNLESDTS